MTVKCVNIAINIFKFVCGISALFMVGFWTLKFHKNEDVSEVKYISYEYHKDITYPELSICITQPFLYENLLRHSNGTVSVEQYHEYIRGDPDSTFQEEYRKVSFDDVTINLVEYVEHVWLRDNDANPQNDLRCTSLSTCPYVTFKNNFNGFAQRSITKCFGFSVNMNSSGNVKSLYVKFKPELSAILDKIGKLSYIGSGNTYLSLNYPGQKLKHPILFREIWKKESASIKVLSMEVLRHRNKNQGPCLDDWMNYDDMVIKQHHNNIGCSPPYQKASKPLCTKRNEMNASSYLLSEISNGDYPIPCKEMSKFRIVAKEVSAMTDLQFDFTYPSRIKVIQQIKSVDIHSLIGNIGGYIGLFLGK